LFTVAGGREVFVHQNCWQPWYDALIETALAGTCSVCGAKGRKGDPLGIYPAGNVAGVVGHPRCFCEWLKRNPEADIAKPRDE
jgi:hypothetical protein